MSLFGKIRTLALGNLHALLDKTIDLNSIAAVQQHVRDLEDATHELDESAVVAAGAVRSVRRELDNIAAKAEELDRTITILLTDDDDSNDSQALPIQARLNELTKRQKAKAEELASAEQTAKQLNDAATALGTKLATMVEQVRTLEAQDNAAKAKAKAAGAITAAAGALGNGADVSVDDVADRIRRRADVADERFDRAMDGLGATTGRDVAIAAATADLVARKAALKAAKAAAAGTEPMPSAT